MTARNGMQGVWSLEGGFPVEPAAPGQPAAVRARRPLLGRLGVRRRVGRWARSWRHLRRRRRVAEVVVGAELLVLAGGLAANPAVVPVAFMLTVPTALAWAYIEAVSRVARNAERRAARAASLRLAPRAGAR
jgi:hypothetical protein